MRQDRLLSELGYSDKVETSGVKLAVIEDVNLGGEGEPYITARPIYNRQFINADGEIENAEAALVFDVPVLYSSTQNFAIWTPPKKGDTGLLIYSDQSFDIWWLEGLTAIDTDNPRRKNRSDCFFLQAGWSKKKPMLEASQEWLEMRNMENSRRVGINGEQVHLQSNFWNLMVSDFGFDVQVKPQLGDTLGGIVDTVGSLTGVDTSLSLLDEITDALTAASTGLFKLGQTAEAGDIIKAVAKIKLIKGTASAPNRDRADKERP